MQPISADSHVTEGADVFIGLAERFGDEAPRVMNAGTADDAIVIPAAGRRGISRRTGTAGLRLRDGVEVKRLPGHKPEVENLGDDEITAILARGFDGLRPGIRDGARRGEDQDVDGVAAEFLYPGYFGMFRFANHELTVACQRNYNDWLYDYADAAGGRLYGLAAIPLHDPKAGLVELERVVAMGYKGGCIPCTAPPERPYRDECYEPIWALAEEAGFPLSMHVGTNSYVPREFRTRDPNRDAIFGYANAPSAVQRTLIDLICRGVAERHPRLNFVVSEFNAGWIANWLNRVDQGLFRELSFRGGTHTGARPREIWRRQFHATIEDDRAAVLTRELLGIETLMWGSDYPHLDSTWPCSLAVLDEIFDGVPDADRAKITRENVKALYRLD